MRSEYTPYGQIVKKTPFVAFPLILDITDFTTSGSLHMDADGPISRHATPEFLDDRSVTLPPSSSRREKPPRVLYRLQALICHYGFTHSFGHFVAYRRKPSLDRPTKACPDYCDCQDCGYYGQVRGKSGGWLRISDADVETVLESHVLAEQGSAFLFFYEKVLDWDGVDRTGKVATMDQEGGSTTVSALMEEMKRNGGDEAMRKAWATS